MPATRRKGRFERALPIAGFILNTIASVSTSAVDFIAMRIVSKSAGISIVTGTIGSIAGIVLNWLVFLFSNARHDYATIGQVIDQRICGDNMDSTPSNCPNCPSYKMILVRVGLSGAVLATCVLDSIAQFQEIQSLGTTARSEGVNYITEDLAFWYGISLATISFTAEFLTFNSFANLAIVALQARLLTQAALIEDSEDPPNLVSDQHYNIAQPSLLGT